MVEAVVELEAGEKVAALVCFAPILATTVTTVIADPRLLEPTQDLFESAASAGLEKLVPGMTMNSDLVSKNEGVQLALDVAPLLREAGIRF